MAKTANKQAASDKPKAESKPKPRPEPTPARVLQRVLGMGRYESERIVGQLGDEAAELPKLYAAKRIAEIRQLSRKPDRRDK